MANSFKYQDNTYRIGDTVTLTYKIKEGEKERKQLFKGIIIKFRGQTPETKMLTIRKISKSGIGVERIIPLISPFIASIKLVKKGINRRAKIYYIRNLSGQKLTQQLYRKK